MPTINKEAFLKRIGSKAASGYEDPIPGAADENAAPEGGMSCGEQLARALGMPDVDFEAVDAALKEAVSKYGGG